MGHIFAQYGVESNAGVENALASHAYTFIYDPYTHTGAIATLNVTDTWSVQSGLVLGSDDTRQTLVLGLVNFQTRYTTNFGPQMAGYTLGALPLLVLFAFGMRQFVAGLTAGALKL